ncbi:aminotransferase class III-fold pyridoxal phosphate-dependent enzyme [soil metagenome]
MVLRRETEQQQAGTTAEQLYDAAYIAAHPGSLEHFESARDRFPSGVTHDGRYAEPFNIVATHAEGAYKWDVDDNRYIDYVTGHGSLILGHNHPQVINAVAAQLQKGTHLGANHPLELAWAEAVIDIVPSAEVVRFHSSGTEAVMMALRMARNYTGRTTFVQFAGHFHGWGDTAFGGAGGPGLPAALRGLAEVLECGDLDAVEAALADETVAAVIIETSHPDFFTLPDPTAYLQGLRDITERTGTVLIFDEVVSGFRWAPGGAQEYYGVTPDVTTLAKILAGGLPGGAVAGRADIVNTLSFDPQARGGRAKIAHPGTFNANPLSAAAGVACLELVGDPAVQEKATAAASAIRTGVNRVLRDLEIPGCAYGAASMVRIALGGEDLPPDSDLLRPIPGAPEGREATNDPALRRALNLGMLMGGVHLFNARAITSIAHSDEDIAQTVATFGETIEKMKTAGLLET